MPLDGTQTVLPTAPGSSPAGGGGALIAATVWPDTNEATSLLRYTFYDVGSATLKKTRRSKEAQQATIAGSGTLVPIVYGPALLGARIAGTVPYQGALVLLAVWCRGEIDAIEELYVNGEPADARVTATHYTGTQAQTADPTLVAACAARGVVYADALLGIAYSVVRIPPKTNTGFPRLLAKVRGLKVATSDGGTPTYSDNPAYALADFITNSSYGMGREVDWSTVTTVATACDALVGSPAEKKRLIALSLDTPQECVTWLNVLRDYAGCWAIPEGESYRLVADAAGSSVMSFTSANILERSLKLAKRGSLTSPTVVEVVYTDTSAVPWRDATVSVSAAGVSAGITPRRVTRLQKPGITRYSEAYRYAVERLNDSILNDLTVTFAAFDEALELQVGDIIDVTHPIGLTAKLFRVMAIAPSSPGRWTITAREYDPSKYSTTVVTGPSTPDTSLPSPSVVTEPTGLAVAEDVFQVQTGRFASRLVVTWTGPTRDDYLFLEGFSLTISDGTNVSTYELPYDATEFASPALPEGILYTVSLRARSAITESDAVFAAITNNGKAALPSDVASITAYSVNGEAHLSWPAATDLDLTGYELRWSAQSGTWAEATHLAFVAAPALSYSTTVIPAGDRRIWVKALDSVRTDAFPHGQESASAASYDFTASSSSVSNTDEHAPGSVTLTNMIAYDGGYVTAVSGDTFAALFWSALSTYTNPLATYHASGTSGLVTDTIDLGTVAATSVETTLAWTDLSGTGQPYIEHKVNSGDSWTRVNGQSAIVNARYLRWGIEATTTETIHVTDVGVLRATRDATDNFVQQSDVLLWLGA